MADLRHLNTRQRRVIHARGSVMAVLLLLSALVPLTPLEAQQAPAAQDPPPAATRPATSPAGRGGFPGARFGGRSGFGGAGGAPVLGEGPSCTIDATIYDVRMTADLIGLLDIDALVKASVTPEAFEKALASVGTAKPVYRVSQSVRLFGDTITVASEVPVVTNTRVTDRGQAISTVQYQSTGAMFAIAGRAGAPGGAELDLSIQLAASDGAAAAADAPKTPLMRKATLSHKGPFQPGKPFVLVSIDAGSVDAEGKAVAYITRVTLGEPQTAPAK